MSGDTCVLFHTKHHTFQPLGVVTGEFPVNAGWLHAWSFQRKKCDLTSPSNSSKSRGSPKKALPSALPSPSREAATPPPVSFPVSVLICAWMRQDEFLIPEIWNFLLPPEQECRRLNFQQRIFNLDLRLEMFIVVDGRAFLLGSDDSQKDEQWNICAEIMPDI
jgi:hypothetical protein